MGSRHGLTIIRSCSASLARQGEILSHSLVGSLKALDIIFPPVAYPKGAMLFDSRRYRNGALTVRMAKREESKAKQVKINVSGNGK
jgi:hypothetical protein